MERKMNRVQILFVILSLLSLIATFTVGLYNFNYLIPVGTIAFLAFLCFAFLGSFKEFKLSASGLEAKMRESIKKAESTINETQELIKVLAPVTLSLVKGKGRLGSYNTREAEELKESILKVVRQLNISEEEISGMLNEWHAFVEGDFVDWIIGAPLIPQTLPPALRGKWKGYRRLPMGESPSPEELRKFLLEYTEITSETETLLDDYGHYLETREIRNPNLLDPRSSR